MLTRIALGASEPFAGGREFGTAGAYEKLSGRAFGELDPSDSRNAAIALLDRAPRGENGRVSYWTDFCVLRPKDPGRGSGRLLFEAPNRGAKNALVSLNGAAPFPDPSALLDPGDGLLMRLGWTVAWCGWQGDLLGGPPLLALGAPEASEEGGPRLARVDLSVDQEGVRSLPLSGDRQLRAYPCATPDKSRARLTVRERAADPRVEVPAGEWDFAVGRRSSEGGWSVTPSAESLYLPGGFKPRHVYELIYPASRPLVLGVGLAAVRDFVSLLRGGGPQARELGLAAGSLRWAYGWGRSQSGRFLRELLYYGFNEDEGGRRVFDAVLPNMSGGGRLSLNRELARPSTSSRQHVDQLEPELFPFGYHAQTDPQTGREDALLKRPTSDPYVLHVQTATEYWQKRGCLAHTDGRGKDVALPEGVRVYHLAGAQHFSHVPPALAAQQEALQHPARPLPIGPALRAILLLADRWVVEGKAPPPSRVPEVSKGTLVTLEQARRAFPAIPGARFPAALNRQLFLDYGAQPPRPLGGEYAVLVPALDADGNELGGLRLPALAAPAATYAGWNLWKEATPAAGELADLLGSWLPFARTAAERRAAGDARPSLEERYAQPAEQERRARAAAAELVKEGLLLEEDAEAAVRAALP